MEIFFSGQLDKDRTLPHFSHINFSPNSMITNIFDSFKQRMFLDSKSHNKSSIKKISLIRKQKNLWMAQKANFFGPKQPTNRIARMERNKWWIQSRRVKRKFQGGDNHWHKKHQISHFIFNRFFILSKFKC